ncbi:periplasmic heavy metal sensor [Tranquillimonas rosea]|uniref:periplasmic heavy metal sensor n=1 Tax=Tranquillimonas rosea TaxID=641238 RepID=UPI003BA8F6BC
MSDHDTPRGPNMSRRARLLLAVSLAVNLLVLGIVAGSIVFDGPGRHGGRHHWGDMDPALRLLGPTPFVMALEKPQKEALAEAARGRRAAFEGNRALLGDRFEATLDLLRAERFDSSAFVDAIAAQGEVFRTQQRMTAELISDRVSAMSPEARRDYADRLDRSLDRVRRRD